MHAGEALPFLLEKLHREKDPSVQAQALYSIAHLGRQRYRRIFRRAMASPHEASGAPRISGYKKSADPKG